MLFLHMCKALLDLRKPRFGAKGGVHWTHSQTG
jgi:hypothetical protein